MARQIVHIHPALERAHILTPDGDCWCDTEILRGEDGVVVYHRDALSRRLGLRGRFLAESGMVIAPWNCTRVPT